MQHTHTHVREETEDPWEVSPRARLLSAVPRVHVFLVRRTMCIESTRNVVIGRAAPQRAATRATGVSGRGRGRGRAVTGVPGGAGRGRPPQRAGAGLQLALNF